MGKEMERERREREQRNAFDCRIPIAIEVARYESLFSGMDASAAKRPFNEI
jgi:hypothetical protein